MHPLLGSGTDPETWLYRAGPGPGLGTRSGLCSGPGPGLGLGLDPGLGPGAGLGPRFWSGFKGLDFFKPCTKAAKRSFSLDIGTCLNVVRLSNIGECNVINLREMLQ